MKPGTIKLIRSVLLLMVVLLLAAIAVPNFVKARYTTSGMPVAITVQVVDAASKLPVSGAHVAAGFQSPSQVVAPSGALTKDDGAATVSFYFPASGRAGGEGTATIRGALFVKAQDYAPLEIPFSTFFGRSLTYTNAIPALTCSVSLKKL